MDTRHPRSRHQTAIARSRRVGKANGSRECAPDGVPTIFSSTPLSLYGGHGARAPLPTLRLAFGTAAAGRRRRQHGGELMPTSGLRRAWLAACLVLALCSAAA